MTALSTVMSLLAVWPLLRVMIGGFVTLPRGHQGGFADAFSSPSDVRHRCCSFLPMASSSNDDKNANNYNYNPLEDETPEERTARLELVRKLQQSFYKEEIVEKDNDHTDDDSSSMETSTIVKDLPLWRVQWKELPGSQNILNVHVPHYTNMFQKILKGQIQKWEDDDHDESASITNQTTQQQQDHYFGHIFLPEGSANLDNPDYELQEGDMGVLMRISDSRQQMDDGRLSLIVQALERFRISRVVRSHSPYAVADVEILPDHEQIVVAAKDGATNNNNGNDSNDDCDLVVAKEAAVARALEYHPFEVRAVAMEECEAVQLIDGSRALVGISPLSNYDESKRPPTTTLSGNNNLSDTDLVALAETKTWEKVNELLGWLSMAGEGVGIPVPTQILGLLPKQRCSSSEEENGLIHEPWPSDFYLGQVVAKMEASKTRLVGTHSKSPFVRVDDAAAAGSSSELALLRRAQRLSYVVWTLTESISVGGPVADERYDRQRLLEIGTTLERLELAIEKTDKICSLLRNILRRQG